MPKKSPHTQTHQNTSAEQADLENNQDLPENHDQDEIYIHMEGAETGGNRSPRRVQSRGASHQVEPEIVAHEGHVSTRTPDGPAQGVTSHSSKEESARQKEVVRDRPDAQAGVNHSK